MFAHAKTAFGLAALLALVAGAAPAQDPPPAPEEAPAPPHAERPDLSAEEELARLLDALGEPDAANPQALERRIIELWSQSGSPTADHLLARGRAALQAEKYRVAVEHLTALTDHAPTFAEGWNARATAFYMMEEYGLAMSDIERVLALNPRHFGALGGLGIILDQADRPAAALAAFRAAQEINPHRERVNRAVERLSLQVEGREL